MAPIKPYTGWKWKVLKLISLALCVVLFFWQFNYIFRDYLDGKTTITTEQGYCCQIAVGICLSLANNDFTQKMELFRIIGMFYCM